MTFDPARNPSDIPVDPQPIHGWFSLSYASWLTVPRLVMQSMPSEWQAKMVALLDEMNETFDWCPEGADYRVMERCEDGKLRRPDLELCDYRRGSVEHLRRPKSQ